MIILRKIADGHPGHSRLETKEQKKTNKLGVKGVHYDRGKYRATIYVNNKRIDLGRYIDIEDAKKARKCGEIEYWGGSA